LEPWLMDTPISILERVMPKLWNSDNMQSIDLLIKSQ